MEKVVIGMSGGVDSSVAAYLLKKQGYEVIGLFMRNWDSLVNDDIKGNPNLNNNICPQEQDYNDAKKVADSLGLKLLRIDYIKEYWEHRQVKEYLEELKRYRDLDEQGLLLRLPCKVGDTVYYISDGFIEPCTVEVIFLADYKDKYGNTIKIIERF